MSRFEFEIGKDPSKNKGGAQSGYKTFEFQKDGINIYASPGGGNYWNGSSHSYYNLCFISMSLYGIDIYCKVYDNSPVLEKVITMIKSENKDEKKFIFLKKLMFDHIVKNKMIINLFEVIHQAGFESGKKSKVEEFMKVLNLH